VDGNSGHSEVLREISLGLARDRSALESSIIWVILLELMVELGSHPEQE